MKNVIKIIAIAIVLVTMGLIAVSLTSCGNQQLFDTTYTFDYAMVHMPDGSCKTIEIASWLDYEDGDQIQIKSKDGTTYLVHSSNAVLVSE